MARKINYIDPVDSVQGLLGSKQDLRYAEKDNKGYFSPAGKVNAARNYQTRMIGMVRTRSGSKYYAVRKKSSFNANPATIRACALMAAARLIAQSWMEDLNVVVWAQQYFSRHALQNQYRSFYQWMFNEAYWRIAAGEVHWTFNDDGVTRNLGDSPWQVSPNTQSIRSVPQTMMVKFWSQLVSNGCYIFINGQRCPFIDGWGLDNLEAHGYVNIMDVFEADVGDTVYFRVGSYWLTYHDGTYVGIGPISPDAKLYFTTVMPTPPQSNN